MAIAAGLTVVMGGVGTADLAAQGNGKGKARATERFEERDQRATSTQRRATTARGVTRDTRTSDDPWYRRGTTDRRDGDIYDRRGTSDDRGDIYDRNDDRYDNRNQGPAFCRSGAGHPTKGRQWCYDKGYGMGSDRWGRAGWEDVVFGRADRRYDGRMSGSVLQDVLGRTVYSRLNTQARALGGGALSGRWLDASAGPRILQVHAGARPLAEFYDQNRDGRVDLVMLNRGR